jgi:hypothetical protein
MYWYGKKIENIKSGTILEDFILKENIENILGGNGIGNPSWDFDVKILLGSSLCEYFLEFIGEIFILSLKAIDNSILVLYVPLIFSDLMLEAVDLVVLDILQFIQLPLSCLLAVIGLVLYESVIFILLGLPSRQIFLCLSSEISFSFLKVSNFIVA